MANQTVINTARGSLYKIENKLNGKVYVGQTTQPLYKRFHAHCSFKTSSVSLVKLAINKYGRENFSFELLEECDAEALNEKEIYYIGFYSSIAPRGYNLMAGGNAARHGAASRKTMSASRKRYYDRVGRQTHEEKKLRWEKNRRRRGIRSRADSWLDDERREETKRRMAGNSFADVSKLKEIKKKKVMRSDGKIFDSVTEAALDTGCLLSSISRSIDGKNPKRKTVKGFSFVTLIGGNADE